MQQLTKQEYITFLIDSKGYTTEEAKDYLSQVGTHNIKEDALNFWRKDLPTKNEGGTRIFFIVDSLEDNEDIFETLEEAKRYINLNFFDNKTAKPRLYIAYVKNCFYEKNTKSWNYNDYADTFEFIKQLN